MLYISFVELLPQGTMILSGGEIATSRGTAWAVLSFFLGIALIAGVDRLVPQPVNPHEFAGRMGGTGEDRSEEHTSELQSRGHLVCRLLLEKKKQRSIHS